MPTIKLNIDKYHPDKNGNVAVRIEFGAKGKMSPYAIGVSIKPKNWDTENAMLLPTEPRYKAKNKIIETRFENYRERYEEMLMRGTLPNNARKIREAVINEKTETPFIAFYISQLPLYHGRTRQIYQETLRVFDKHYKQEISFSDITPRMVATIQQPLATARQQDQHHWHTPTQHQKHIQQSHRCQSSLIRRIPI